MSTRTYTRNAFETQLDGGINNSATTISVDSTSGLANPMYLCIEPDSPTKREYIRVGGISGTDLTSVTRGLDGSASGAQSHDSGVVVRAVFVHQMLNDLFGDIETLEGAVSSHVGTGGSTHPAATGSVAGFMSSSDKTKLDGVAAGAKADHGALTGLGDDDHTQYLNSARHSAISHANLDTAAIHGGTSGEINALTNKSAPTGADLVVIEDSAASFAKKKATLSSIVSALTAVDHGALAGLNDNDHPQYLLSANHTLVAHTDLGLLALAGGTMTGSLLMGGQTLNMQNGVIANVAEPTGGAAAMPRSYADARYAFNSHNHAGSAITSGTVSIDRLPTGSGGSNVALGNHNHNSSYVGLTGSETISGAKTFTGNMIAPKLWLDDPLSTSNNGLPGWRHDTSAAANGWEIMRLTSSERFKENISDTDLDELAQKIERLRVVDFDSIHEADQGKRLSGVLAEEAVWVFPNLVGKDSQGRIETFSYDGLIVPLLASVQALSRRLSLAGI